MRIEGGLGQTPLGKTILAACFITDFGTVLALGTRFANFNIWLLVFVVVFEHKLAIALRYRHKRINRRKRRKQRKSYVRSRENQTVYPLGHFHFVKID